jgi:hypothetical protein
MTTKANIISQLKAEYPTLRVGTEEDGYTELNATEYADQIEIWADQLLLQELKTAEEKAAADAKAALLAKLGITEDEAKLLLG